MLWQDLKSKGRGQMGTNWESEAGKNLTFSVLKNFTAFKIEDQFAVKHYCFTCNL